MIPEPVLRLLQAVSRRHLILTRVELTFAVLARVLLALGLYAAAARVAFGSPGASGLLAVATATGALLFARLRRPPLSPIEAALLVDRRLRLKDRLTTAVERHSESLHSPLGHWLMRDAEQHARFVDPKEVVPLRPAIARRGAVAVLGAAALVAAFALPLPEALLAPSRRLAQPVDAPVASVEELLERAEVLQARASALRTPEMRRVGEDLSQLQAGLRNRSLPKNEALALLEFFERRIESAGGAVASGSELSQESLDRLQSLAERMRLLAPLDLAGAEELAQGVRHLAQELAGTGPASALERALSALEAGDAAAAAEALREAMEQAGSIRGATSSARGDDVEPAADGAPSGPPGAESGASGPESNPADSGDQGASARSLEASGGAAANDPSGAGTLPGVPSEGSFRRLNERLLPAAPLQGEVGEGPLRSGRLQASFAEAQGVQEGFDSETTGGEPLGGWTLTPDESIPLDYREPVRLYFRRLEPGA